VCYREIDLLEDCDILQQDINKLSNWAQAWEIKFQPVLVQHDDTLNEKGIVLSSSTHS